MKSLSCVFFWCLNLVTAFRASGSQRFLPGKSCLLAPKKKGEKWNLRGFLQKERLSALLDNFILLCFKGQSLPFSQGSFHREGNGGWRRESFHFSLHLPADSWITPGCFKKGSSLVGRGGGSRKDCVFWSLLACLIILYTVLCKKFFWNFYRIFFSIYSYSKILAIFPVLYNISLCLACSEEKCYRDARCGVPHAWLTHHCSTDLRVSHLSLSFISKCSPRLLFRHKSVQ